MMTYFVTGGAGFIGSNYIHYLFETYGDTIQVINYDALTYAGNLHNLTMLEGKSGYQFIKGDITDRKTVELLFDKYDVDYVIHFAAESHVDRSIHDPSIFVKTNVLGTQTLVDVAHKKWYDKETETYIPGKKFVHVSTDEVYGSLGTEGYFTETTPIDPHSPYSASKASSDLVVKAYWDTFGFPMNTTRCSNNYGPYQFPEKLIPLMIHNALCGKDLPVYGDGKNVRDWLYVKDHCRAIERVAKEGRLGEVYNIGGHNERQNIQIIKVILEVVPKLLAERGIEHPQIGDHLIRFVTDRKGHDKRYAIDASKIEQELGWVPETPFEVGIVKTIEWYLDNEDWLKTVTSGDYENYYKSFYSKH